MSKLKIYRAEIGAMRPLHPAWSLWITDLVGLNISLFSGFVLMRSDSYRRVTKGLHGPWDSTVWHEAQHHRQKKEAGLVRFAFRYWFSRKWRARYEREAYEVTLARLICYEDGHGRYGVGEEWARQIAASMSSWKYAWMMSKKDATEWAFSLLDELLESWPRISWEAGGYSDDG